MNNQFFEVTKVKGLNIIKLLGAPDQANVDKIFHQIEEVIGDKKNILDLSNVNFVNSTFIGYLYHLYEINKNIGRYLCFVNGQENVMDSFNLTGILDLIPYYKTLDEAKLKLK